MRQNISRGTLSPAEVLALMQPPKRSKYGVDRSAQGKLDRTWRGVVYDSKAEMVYGQKLDLEMRSGKWSNVERQVIFKLYVNGKLIGGHRVDFVVTHAGSGVRAVHEYKGSMTASWRVRAKLFCALHPEIDYIVVTKKGERKL